MVSRTGEPNDRRADGARRRVRHHLFIQVLYVSSGEALFQDGAPATEAPMS